MAPKPGKTTRTALKIRILNGFIDVTPAPDHPNGVIELSYGGGEVIDPPAQAGAWVNGGLAEWVEVEEEI